MLFRAIFRAFKTFKAFSFRTLRAYLRITIVLIIGTIGLNFIHIYISFTQFLYRLYNSKLSSRNIK